MRFVRCHAQLFAAAAVLIAQVPLLGQAEAATVKVNVQNISFSPHSVHIIPGDTVHWVWVSGSHSTTSGGCPGGACAPDGRWDSGAKSSGSFDRVFDQPGSYPYFCSIHGSMMQGLVLVSAPPPLQTGPSAQPVCGQAPLDTIFSDGTTGGQLPYAFLWDFGDGTPTSAEQSPTHSYGSPGAFTAQIEVTDAALAVSSASVDILTSATPIAVILTAKSGNGKKLAITGTGLPITCAIEINGQPAPVSKCTGGTKGKAKGAAALQALLPPGQTVVIRVRDLGTGDLSCPLSFTRPVAAAPQPY